ncbi:MAG: SIR2 family NAD-dependent protein deacylase [Solirubrobacteraceae bacterium]
MGLDAAELRQYARLIGKRIDEGRVIPFLGAGANLYDRPPTADWHEGSYLPSGTELASYLAAEYEYPGADSRDLVRVAQYVDLVTGGEGALFDELHPVFTGTYRPTGLHRFLAELPARQRAAGGQATYPLIVTTNYDDALERAFADAGEVVDVVYYAAEHDEPGRFVHLSADGERRPIPKHTDYRGLDLQQRSIVFKIHGAVDRSDQSADNYVITEDHYIDYLANGNLSKLIPAYLMARMRNSHFLFLGYGMRDWNLRVILHHIWSQQVRRFGSWAIERDPDPIDEKFWQRHRVEIVEARLEDWVDAMNEARS